MTLRASLGNRCLVLAAVVAVVAGGCAGAGGRSAGTTPAGISSRAMEVSLAASGVATVADESSSEALVPVTGPSVLRLTAWQASNLAAEAAGHGGITGVSLNAMLPAPGAPPVDDIVGSWLLAGKDGAERSAARLMGGADLSHPDTVVFPSAVLELFVADALQHVVTASPVTSASTADLNTARGTAGIELTAQTDVLSHPCTSVANFVSSVLDRVFSLLKLNPVAVSNFVNKTLGGGLLGAIGGGLAAWGATFLGHLVDSAQAALEGIIRTLTAPVLNILRLVLGGLATITMIASYLKRWRADVTPDPTANAFALTGAADKVGTFTVQIDKNAEIEDWPEALVDCAKAAGVPLPTLSKEGLPVTWTVLSQQPGLVAVQQPVTGPPYVGELSKDLSSRMLYATGHESAALARTGMPVTPTVTATVGIRRTEVDELRKFVTAFAEAQIPHVLASIVDPMIEYYVELATKQLDRITQVEGSASITVLHHVPKPKQPPGRSNCASSGPAVPTGTYSGPISATLTDKLHIRADGVTIPNAGGGTELLKGSVSLTSTGARVSGTMTLSGTGRSHVGLPGATNVHSGDHGSLHVSISGSATSPVVSGTLSGAWASFDAPVINGSGSSTNHVHAGLHLTHVSCTSISGNVIAMFRQIAAPVAKYLSFGGDGAWTATRN